MKTRKNSGKSSRKVNKKEPFHNAITVMPWDARVENLPYTVVKLLTGGNVRKNYQNKPDVVMVRWNNQEEVLSIADFELVKSVADIIWKQDVEIKNLHPSILHPSVVMDIHRRASEILRKKRKDSKNGKKHSVLMVRDESACGYWRMVIPARYMNRNKYEINVTQVETAYDYFLEYDVILVQRLHSWSEYYILEDLKRAGKRIVYDIDDDMFHIDPSNPASMFINDDAQQAAYAIMGLADVITTTNEYLKKMLGFEDKTVVIPNAMDFGDGWVEIDGTNDDFTRTSYPDKWKRIFWQGGQTHAEDWTVVAEAVDSVMKENEDVRLVLLGFVPPVVSQMIEDPERPWWDSRVEYMKLQDIESYLQVMKQIKADVSIAPLTDTEFNRSKSNIKFLESTACGIPVIASDVRPYTSVIQDGVNGFLASDSGEWYEKISMLLDDKAGRKRGMDMVRMARKTVSQFDIRNIAKEWENILFGEGK